MNTVDARGLSCPEPVLRARQAIERTPAGGQVEVLVETVTSRENVRRAAQSMGCAVEICDHEGGFRLVIRKAGGR